MRWEAWRHGCKAHVKLLGGPHGTTHKLTWQVTWHRCRNDTAIAAKTFSETHGDYVILNDIAYKVTKLPVYNTVIEETNYDRKYT